MKRELLKSTGLLIGLVFVFSLFPQSAAAVVWEDDFNDGNYNDWTVGVGDWQVTDGELESYYVDSYIWRIWHASLVVEGTWSLDVKTIVSLPVFEHTILFMANGTDATFSYDGYGIRLIADDILFMKFSDGSTTPLGMVTIEGMDQWVHLDITRNSTGGFHIFANATSSPAEPDLVIVDTDYSYSERFVIHHNREGAGFDNIVVSDTIDITPPDSTTPPDTTTTNGGTTPPPIDTTLIIVGAGVTGVVIIAAVVLLRNRR